MARHVPEGYQLAPPDGGWSWVVLCGTVLIGLMISLPLAALGFIFNDIIVQMDTTAATAAWIPALTVSVSQVIAPFNTMIITRWSCRISFMIGGFLCALGLTLSFFATMVETLFVTFGIFVGAGLGLSSNTIYIVLGQYFKKYYGISTGIIMASFASGRFIFSPLIQLMLDQYGFRGVCLILGSLLLNVLVGAALCQPVKWHQILVPIEKSDSDHRNQGENASHNNNNCNGVHKDQDKGPTEMTASVTDPEKGIRTSDFNENVEVAEKLLSKDGNKLVDGPTTILKNSSSMYFTSTWDMSPDMVTPAEDSPHSQSAHEPGGCAAFCSKGPLKGLQFSLLKSPIFYIALVAGILSFISAIYISVFTPPFALEHDVKAMDVATLTSIRSGCEIAGRLGMPFIQRMCPKIPLIVFYCGLNAFQGVTILVFSFMTSFTSMTAVSIIIGLSFGASTSLSVVLLVECVGMSQLGSLLALTQFIMAFVFLGIGPFMGFLRDVTQSYEVCFMFMAVAQFLCAGIWALKPCVMSSPDKLSKETSR